jgi:hypothetical protein
MKHYHDKEELVHTTDDTLLSGRKIDVHYIVVAKGDKYRFRFNGIKLVGGHKDRIRQGFKIWLNRCKATIDGVPTDNKVIFWNDDKSYTRNANRHTYVGVISEVTLDILSTDGDNPNIGIFNVWTSDGIRCMEFGDKSWITVAKGSNRWTIDSRHGWPGIELPMNRVTIELSHSVKS